VFDLSLCKFFFLQLTTRTLVNFKDATGMKEIANAQKQDTCEKSGSSVDEIY